MMNTMLKLTVGYLVCFALYSFSIHPQEKSAIVKSVDYELMEIKKNDRSRIASVTLTINASIEQVWSVLTQIKKYSEWNPFVYHIQSDQDIPSTDSKMLFSVRFESGKETKSKEIVTKFTPPVNQKDFALWSYRFGGFVHGINMIRAHRVQTLRALLDGSTEYSSTEVFTGWGRSFVPLEDVQKGFEAQGAALKEECEK